MTKQTRTGTKQLISPVMDGRLEKEIFWTRDKAQAIVEWYRQAYNHRCPYSSLHYQTPAEVARLARSRATHFHSDW